MTLATCAKSLRVATQLVHGHARVSALHRHGNRTTKLLSHSAEGRTRPSPSAADIRSSLARSLLPLTVCLSTATPLHYVLR